MQWPPFPHRFFIIGFRRINFSSTKTSIDHFESEAKLKRELTQKLFVSGKLSLEKLMQANYKDLMKVASFLNVFSRVNKEALITRIYSTNLTEDLVNAPVFLKSGYPTLARPGVEYRKDSLLSNADLLVLKRKEVQALARKYGLQGNQRSSEILREVAVLQKSGATGDGKTISGAINPSSTFTSMVPPSSSSDLSRFQYRELQKYALRMGVKTRCSRTTLVERLAQHRAGTLPNNLYTTNTLRSREPPEYRSLSIKEIRRRCAARGIRLGRRVDCIESLLRHEAGTLDPSCYVRPDDFTLPGVNVRALGFRQIQALARAVGLRTMSSRADVLQRLHKYCDNGGKLNLSVLSEFKAKDSEERREISS